MRTRTVGEGGSERVGNAEPALAIGKTLLRQGCGGSRQDGSAGRGMRADTRLHAGVRSAGLLWEALRTLESGAASAPTPFPIPTAGSPRLKTQPFSVVPFVGYFFLFSFLSWSQNLSFKNNREKKRLKYFFIVVKYT